VGVPQQYASDATLTRHSMLEDQSIQHLISWASTNESFVMSPSSEFSKVLSYVHLESSRLNLPS